MEEHRKTKAELIDELIRMRQTIAEDGQQGYPAAKPEDQDGSNEQKLKESEERYRIAIEHSNDGVAVVREERLLYVNQKFLEIFGYDSSGEVLGKSLEITVHPDDRERVLGYAQGRQHRQDLPSRYDFSGMRKDGSTLSIEVSTTTTFLAGESVSLAFLRDVTNRKEAGEALEARLRIEEFICSISTRFIDVRPEEIDSEIKNVLCSIGQFMGEHSVHLVLFHAGRDRESRYYCWHDEGLTSPCNDLSFIVPLSWLRSRLSSLEALRLSGPDDLPLWADIERNAWRERAITSMLAIPLKVEKEPVGFIGLPSLLSAKEWEETEIVVLRLVGEILVNVLNRKKMEEDIRLNEGRMQALLDAIPDTMVRIGTDGIILDSKVADSDGFFSLTFFPVGRLLFDTSLPPQISSDIVAAIRHGVHTGKAQQYEWNLMVDERPLAFEARIVRSGENEAVCIIRNVSERMAAEQALRESESKFRNLTEQSMAGVYLLQDNLFRYANRQLAEVFGYQANEIINKKGPGDLVHPEDRPVVMDNVRKRVCGEVDSMHYEFRGARKDGEPIYVEVYGSRTIYQGRPAIVGTLLDITERKKLQAQVIQSEKMKAIGTLAGGIAHDFNNILMAIQGYTSLMLHLLDPKDPHFAKLEGIEDLVRSGSDLTKQLLTFASGGAYEIKAADLNGIVRKTSSMFARTRKEITIESKYTAEGPVVDVDSGQIEQMLLNLYVNAWQAMPEGGTLTLTTEKVSLDRPFVRTYSVRPGKYAKISVSDTGTGMNEKTRERVFEPFFTTKKRGRGTGLGLASVYNIITGHGGIINVESEEGRGSTFSIYLPLSKKAVEKAEPVSHAVLKGKEKILLVDDEDTVITVSKDMLEALGYSVLVARNGQEAVDIYQAKHQEIDLVILDLIMPDMGGGETFNQMCGINPSVNVVLSSGYSIDGLATKIMEQGCRAFIQKPFTINILSQKLREVLGSKP